MLSLMLALTLLLSACQTAAPDKKPAEAPATETTQEAKTADSGKVDSDKEESTDDGYTSLDDFKLFDENGKLLRTDRGDVGENGMISSGRYEASKIGRKIIEDGGNAIDAAVATAFALSLAEPNYTGIGGGGFMLVHTAEGENFFIDFREKAPAAATPAMWATIEGEDGKLQVIGNQSKVGGKAIGVPGFVAGLTYALDNYGTMELDKIIDPVIELAEKGVTVSPAFASDMSGEYDALTTYSESGDIFLKEKDGILFPYEVGENFKNPDFVNALKEIKEKGRDGFYNGPMTEAMVKVANKYGGVMTVDDFKNYEVEVMEPVHVNYRGYDVFSAPPPSSGGTIVGEILNLVERFDLSQYAPDSPEKYSIFASALNLAYADRAEYMGDTRFVAVPIDGLLSDAYADERAKLINIEQARTDGLKGDPWMFEHEDTTHFTVADKEGNIVALTSTVNHFFGSKVAVPGYGFVLNDEMDDFVPGEGHPNSIAPGKTPLSSMSPTIILKDGEPFAALGSPGGTTIISTVAQVISNLIDYDMTMQEAVDFPRIKGFKDGKITYENRVPQETVDKMTEWGWTMESGEDFERSLGSVNAVRYKDGKIEGGADPRRDSKALGF